MLITTKTDRQTKRLNVLTLQANSFEDQRILSVIEEAMKSPSVTMCVTLENGRQVMTSKFRSCKKGSAGE
jgi:hypothetical protein